MTAWLPGIERAGRILLSGAGGLLIGFAASDRGLPFLPNALAIALGVAAVALGLLAAGRFTRWRRGAPVRGAFALRAVAAVACCAALAAVLYIARPSPLGALDEEAYAAAFDHDARSYRELDAGMERALASLDRAGVPRPGEGALAPEEERVLLDAWIGLRDQAIALDSIRVFHEDYYRIDPSRHGRARHLRSFLLTYAAELALYEKTARFVERVKTSPGAEKFLDAPHLDRDLDAGTLSLAREKLLGARDQARVLAGRRYLDVLAAAAHGRTLAHELGLDWLWRSVEEHLAAVEAIAPLERAEGTVRADLQELERDFKSTWFPVQKQAAEAMGDTRVRRIGWYLVDHEVQEEVDRLLEPGDVLLSRKNWYLSNVGLPGFWPHAILYLGDADKLARYFDEPAVRDWARSVDPGAESLADLLARRHPDAWRRYRASPAGAPHRVIEAVSEGVVFSTLNECAGDYLAALRPRLDKRAKAQAVAEAFAHAGKPYDFDFDFATDHALVCTELVWRAYRPDQDKAGLLLELSQLAGRTTLPANDIAAQYAREHGRAGAQLDFVAFVDANELSRRAFLADEASFRASWRRSKWDVAQP